MSDRDTLGTADRARIDFAPFGLAIGHGTDVEGATGLTVVRGIEAPFRAAASVVGRATGSRELAVASPEHLVDRVDAILLTGGSAYGLDAAAGVMRWMEERGRGYRVGPGVVPIVPAAVLFDLAPLGSYRARPTPALAYAACNAATPLLRDEGSVGAGTGATVGKALGPARAMKGGIGGATSGGAALRVAVLAAVNAFGDVRDAQGHVIAGARGDDVGFADATHVIATGRGASRFERAQMTASRDAPGALEHTTLCVVSIDVPIPRTALAQLARAATAALYRRITPCGTTFDGDVVFATCPLPSADRPEVVEPVTLLAAEVLAVTALESAIERAVRCAVGRDGVPGLADTM